VSVYDGGQAALGWLTRIHEVRLVKLVSAQRNSSATEGRGRGAMAESGVTPEFQRGWDAALQAARAWHESHASKSPVQASRSRIQENS